MSNVGDVDSNLSYIENSEIGSNLRGSILIQSE